MQYVTHNPEQKDVQGMYNVRDFILDILNRCFSNKLHSSVNL